MNKQFSSALYGLTVFLGGFHARAAPVQPVLQTDGHALHGDLFHGDVSALSPDGTWRASPDAAGTAIWHLPSGEKRRVLPVFGAPAWSGDGQFLAIAGKEVQIWKMPAGTLFRVEKRGRWRVAFAAKSRRFVSFSGMGDWESWVRVFDLEKPQWMQVAAAMVGQKGYGDGPQISSDGSLVVTWNDDGGDKKRVVVQVCDAQTGKVVAEFQAVQGANRVRFSPDGKTLAIGGSRHCLTLWEWQSGRKRELLGASPDDAIFDWQSFNWAPDSAHIVAVDRRFQFRVWETATGRELEALPPPIRGTPSLAWNRFLTSTAILDQTGERIFAIPDAPIPVSIVSWNSNLLAHDGANRVWTWDLSRGKLVAAPEIIGAPETLRWRPNALEAILVRSEESVVRVENWRFSLTSGLLASAFSLSPPTFSGDEEGRRFIPIAVSPSGALGIFEVAKGGWHVRDLRSGRIVRSFAAPRKPSSLVFLGDSAILSRDWSGQSDGENPTGIVRRHHLKTGASQLVSQSPQPIPDWRDSLVASPRGTFVAGFSKQQPRLWLARGWKTLLLGAAANWSSIAFSSDEKWLATRDADGVLWLRALGANGLMASPPLQVGTHLPTPYNTRDALCFSPDGRFLVSGGREGFRMWEIARAREKQPALCLSVWVFPGEENQKPQWLALAPDGRWNASDKAGKWARWRVAGTSVNAPLLPLESQKSRRDPGLPSLESASANPRTALSKVAQTPLNFR